MRRVAWSRDAENDLIGLTDYYEQFGADIPFRLIDRIEAAANRLLEFPKLGPVVPDSDQRYWLVRQTPYILIYRPEPSGIRVLRVRHAATDWKPLG